MPKEYLKPGEDIESLSGVKETPPWEKLDRVELAALEIFASLGYNASSVSLIAKKAGITKSTVYAHCESKAELFQNLLEPVLERELFLLQTVLQSPGTDDPLGSYLQSFQKRYWETPPFLFFFLRAVYTPPVALKTQVKQLSEHFFEKTEGIVSSVLKQQGIRAENLPELSRIYISLLDSVQVSALYCPQLLPLRISDLGKVFAFLCPQNS
ncbi:MAG: TetR/AcrR family transcriptional regulator [Deltaproteobacteria bacterium]|jgi:AcrR family transcriptional regulator|nr:TetR/AcrR family transcriptional regulator [Deltaproteobacteria bacterium]